MYGLSNAATTSNGISHWGDTKVIVSLVASVVLLVTFGFIEVRSKHALVPVRLLRSRDRTGSYLISLCVGTAMFGMFFFLTIFVQTVWGFSPVKSGLSYLPMVAAIMVASGVASQLVSRIGARPLMVGGAAIMAGGMFWMSQLTEHSTYSGGLLGPMMVAGLGLGLVFVPLSLVALARVGNTDVGASSALVNTGQQVGGSIGLAVLGTVAWSAVASNLRSVAAAGACAAAVAAERRLLATALHATVPSSASPIDPPTCWPVFSSEDATPASLFGTPASATSDIGTKISPIPKPTIIIGPSRPPT